MKNIHVLPTDKQSKLYYSLLFDKLLIFKKSLGDISEPDKDYQNIYITSDEEIKEGNWCYHLLLKGGSIIQSKYDEPNSTMKKIILTTDQELIKDGVQAIDDEFLEWFVKNPSCEKVDVEWVDFSWSYFIIIPKEEFKMIECYFIPSTNTSSSTICSNCGQEKFLHTIGEGIKVSTYIVNTKEEPKQIYYNTVGIENGVSVIKGQFNTQQEALDLANKLNEKGLGVYYDWRETLVKEELKQEGKVLTVKEVMEGRSSKYEFIDFDKQETLEEASEKYAEGKSSSSIFQKAHITDFMAGAKWQQENIIINSKIDEIIEFIETNGNSVNDKSLTVDDIYSYAKKLQQIQIKQQLVSDIFRKGIKWQQQRSYSEENIKQAFDAGVNYMKDGDLNKKDWFEQFKKK